jgi:Rrf2 family nitric oxide-sensitive transcriptional repressor
MQLTHFTDYALCVLIFVANKQDRRATINDVSEAHGISEHHLTKVVHRLSKVGYLKAVRGKGGGIKSALLPSEISTGKVIRDIEPLTPAECFVPSYDGNCILYPKCALRRALRSAQLQFLKTLDAHTVADAVPRESSRNAKRRQSENTHISARHITLRPRSKVRA